MTSRPTTPDGEEGRFADRFASLKRNFALGLAGRRDELAAGWQAWAACSAADPPDAPDTPRAAAARAALAAGLHRLAGAAGAYGFDALGRQARDLERQVDSPDAVPAPLAAPFAALQHELATIAGATAGAS
ncbi:Hpt domain-containing protein [Burkholderia sp. BCC1644]|uniref:Hpt domain-containing protein n=1 Tax=Burkholderia sp. BCC1644 TaxID=2676293 RepID=UPI0015910EFF|nr:Hpt domain-containing protein [Burkholderia sp. BCC1644]